MGSRDAIDQRCSKEWKACCNHDGERTTANPFRGAVGGDETRDRRNNAIRHGEQCRCLGLEAEVLDNNGAKGNEASIGNVDGDVEEEHDPDLDVHHSLESLIPIPLAAVNAGAVLSQALDGVPPLLDGEEPGVDGRIGHVNEHKDGVEHIQGAGEEVEVLPTGEGRIFGDQADKPRKEAVDHGRKDRHDY